MPDYARNKKFFSASTLLMLVIAACLSLSLIWHEPVPEAWRIPLTIALTLFSLCITSMRVLVTRLPDLPFAFVRAGGYVSSAFLALFLLVILRDASLGALWLLSAAFPALGGVKEAAFRALLSVPFELGMLAGAFGLAAVGVKLASRVPAVREVRVPVPGLPDELEGLRLAVISDLHIGSSFDGRWLAEVVERTNACRPDFVLLPGDLADGSLERMEAELRPLADLRAAFGVLASPGNHDYYSGLPTWAEKWRSWGLGVLLNAHQDFRVRGRLVRVVGVTDKCARLLPDWQDGMGPPDLRRALSVPATGSSAGTEATPPPADLTILLSHRPELAAESAANAVDLQISGHTHGGQFFFLFPLVSHINKGFRAGLYRVGTMPLYVSPGTGMWGYAPMRLGSRSEISLLVLTTSLP